MGVRFPSLAWKAECFIKNKKQLNCDMIGQFSNINLMRKTVKEGRGFDYIIIVSSAENQKKFWQERLGSLKGKIVGLNAEVLCVSENWAGGAGKLLGTLNALKNAGSFFNLEKELQNGKKVAVYHTAGAGKRTAPLTFAEENRKSALKLPKLIKTGNKKDFLRLLDAVIFSTQIFAPGREGRLCVFWGDQIVIPEKSVFSKEKPPIEIFSTKGAVPTSEKEWQKQWQDYGVLIHSKRGVLQREKINWKEFLILKKELIGDSLEKSLGFFSINYDFLRTLLREFEEELKFQKGSLDTDSHLWLPLSASQKEWRKSGASVAYWKRIAALKDKYEKEFKTSLNLTNNNIGERDVWWDFGNINSYQRNLLAVAQDGLTGDILRKFFGLEGSFIKSKRSSFLKVKNSILVNSHISGIVQNSVIFNARVKKALVNNSLLFDVDAIEVTANGAIGYNLRDNKELVLRNGEVQTDISSSIGKIRMKTGVRRDGKKDWEKKIPGNSLSYCRLVDFMGPGFESETEMERES